MVDINWKYVLVGIVLISGFILSTYLVITNSNLVFKQEGSLFAKSFIIPSSETEGDGGYIRFKSDDRSPSAIEWVTFKNNQKYLYFTINPDNEIEEEVYITLPAKMDKGAYYFQLEFKYLSGETKSKKMSFRVV